MEVFFGIVITILGLLIGSFLNVCIFRIPKKIFFAQSRSFCPKCNAQLKWYENIPVFSYIFLKGKCRTCKNKISYRYPLVELLNCLMYLFAYLKWGVSVTLLINCMFISALIVMAFIDLDTMEIPNGLVLFVILLGAVSFLPQYSSVLWWEKLIGMVCVSVPFFVISLLTRGGIGGGDIKLMFACGLLLGWQLTLVSTLIGLIFGSIIAIIMMIIAKGQGKRRIPFGPILAVGMVLGLFVGEYLLKWYGSFF
ncbi:MAG: prepilin peptidase [Clostridia bacterium]